MTKAIRFEIKDIGTVLLEKSRRAKRLNITVQPFKGVRVAVPYGISMDDAKDITRAKSTWIRKHLVRMHEIEKEILHISLQTPPIDKEKAKSKLASRLAELAEQHGFSFNKVTFRQQKTLWGSCSAKNNISLNLRLAALPDELISYVILHELVHVRIKNHSVHFWKELQQLMPDAKKMALSLKRYPLAHL
ncbi:MAG: DUF45 domain-containing protein [Desulfobacterales bacterium]|nr:DUF45 domain-containing protein [Desulfobacterales bacterium]